MYTLTAHDRKPLTLFGKPYWWSTDSVGRLVLVSHAKLVETVKAANQSLAAGSVVGEN